MMALPALVGTARVQSCGSGTFPSLWAERHSSGNGMFDLCEPCAQQPRVSVGLALCNGEAGGKVSPGQQPNPPSPGFTSLSSYATTERPLTKASFR